MKIRFKQKRMLSFDKIGIVCLLFFYLYMPPITRINIKYLIGCIGWIYVVFHYRKYSMKIWNTIACIGIISIYIMLLGFLTSGTILNTMASKAYIAAFTFPYAMMLGDIVVKNEYDYDDVIKLIGWTAFVEAIFCGFAFLFDGIQTYLLSIMFGYSNNSMVNVWKNYRLFGLAEGMMFAMPILQGIIGSLLLAYAVKKDIYYVVMVPFIWLSGLINARTTIVVIFIGIIFVVLASDILYPKTIKKFIAILIAFATCVLLFARYFGDSKSIEWISSGIREVFSFLTGKFEGYFYIAFKDENVITDFLRLPSGFDFIFGTGSYPRSDIGYIRDLWAGGIVATIPLYLLFFFMLREVYAYLKTRIRQSKAKKVVVFFIVILMSVNVKGEICGINEVTALIVFLFVYSVMSQI